MDTSEATCAFNTLPTALSTIRPGAWSSPGSRCTIATARFPLSCSATWAMAVNASGSGSMAKRLYHTTEPSGANRARPFQPWS